MSLSTLKKKKLDTENRQFNNNWTEKHVFTETAEGKPMCLLCTECISMSKEYNLRRYFNTNHSNFNINYPLGSNIRQRKIQTLTSTYKRSRAVVLALLKRRPQQHLSMWHGSSLKRRGLSLMPRP